MTIGQTIKQLRHDEGLTVQSLSIMCNLSERFISFIEQDKKKPSLRSLTKIADAVDKNMIVTYSPGEKVVNVKFVLRDTFRSRSFDKRIEQLQSRLLQDCIRLCRYNKSEGENLSQETLMQAFLYHYRYNEQSQLYTWLFGIAKNINKANINKDKSISFIEDYIESSEETEEIVETPNLCSFLNKLNPRAKQIYKMRLVGMSYEEIGNELGVKSGTAKMWFFRIKGELKKIINQEVRA